MSQAMDVMVFSHRSVEYYTPDAVLNAACEVLGAIDLDPASCPEAQERVRARAFYTVAEDGLQQRWHGRVWLNPPYGMHRGKSNAAVWADKLVTEFVVGDVEEAILLVKAAVGYKWFTSLFENWPVCLMADRLSFLPPGGAPAGPCKLGVAVFYFGTRPDRFAEVFRAFGRVIMPEGFLP